MYLCYEEYASIYKWKGGEHIMDKSIKVKYKNWKDEVGIRTIIPQNIFFGHTDFHKEDQWLLDVWDVEKDAPRVYALMDIVEFIK